MQLLNILDLEKITIIKETQKIISIKHNLLVLLNKIIEKKVELRKTFNESKTANN